MNNLACWWWWLLLGALLGWIASWILVRREPLAIENTVERIVDRPVDRVVEQIVEKIVDNPVHLARIRTLEQDLQQLDPARGIPLKAPTVEKGLDAEASTGATPASLSAGPRVSSFERAADISSLSYRTAMVDQAAATAAGFKVRGMDDLQVIEGIGPKIAALFHSEGIRLFWQLSDTATGRMQEILQKAGPQFKLANPSTWATQAGLAARNQWAELRALQDVLAGGVDRSGKAGQS